MQQSISAQIRIVETVAVLLVFSAVFVFGIYWVSESGEVSSQQQATEYARLELIEVAKTVMNMPEIKCSTRGLVETICVDSTRIRAFNQLLNQPEYAQYYEDKFAANTQANYKLTVENSVSGEEVAWVFNYTQEDENASFQQIGIPVLLLDPYEDTRVFRVLVLTQEVTR